MFLHSSTGSCEGPVRQTDILKGLSFGEVTTEMRRGGTVEGSSGYLRFCYWW